MADLIFLIPINILVLCFVILIAANRIVEAIKNKK